MFFLENEESDFEKLKDLLILFNNPANWDSILDDFIQIYQNTETSYYTEGTHGNTFLIKVWDDEEASTYTKYHNEILNSDQELNIYYSVYPRCCYCLAVMFLAKNNLDEAETALSTGLALEPDHPLLIIEKANWFNKKAIIENEKQHFATAIDIYNQAVNSRPYMLSKVKAVALRSIGFCNIELGNYDVATKAYQASLKLEHSSKAINGLIIIKELKKGRINSPTKIEWSVGKTKLEDK